MEEIIKKIGSDIWPSLIKYQYFAGFVKMFIGLLLITMSYHFYNSLSKEESEETTSVVLIFTAFTFGSIMFIWGIVHVLNPTYFAIMGLKP